MRLIAKLQARTYQFLPHPKSVPDFVSAKECEPPHATCAIGKPSREVIFTGKEAICTGRVWFG